MVFQLIKQNSQPYQWIIMSVGSLKLEQECPQFALQLASKYKVVVFQLDPQCSKNDFNTVEGVKIFRLTYNFSLDKPDNEFYALISQLMHEKKNVILTSCTLPYIPKEFVTTAYQYRYALGSTLFLVGSFFKNSLAVVYNPLFINEWHKMTNQNEIPWLENAPSEHLDFGHILDVTQGTYLSLGQNDNDRVIRFDEIQKRFIFMGLIVENFLTFNAEDLSRTMHPKLYKQPHLKLFISSDQLKCGSTHPIYQGFKHFNPYKGTRNYIGQIFKVFRITDASLARLQENLAVALIEVIVGEFYRLLMPQTQPKNRFSYFLEQDEYGILSTKIPNFLNLAEAFELKKEGDPSFDLFKSKIDRIGFGKILIACLFFGEFDLNLGNLGIDWGTVDHFYKIDHGCCLPITWKKHWSYDDNNDPSQFIKGSLPIPPDILDVLPNPGVLQNGRWTYNPYHWFGFIDGGNSIEDCNFLDSATQSQLSGSQSNQMGINSLLLQISLLSNETIHAFVSAYKMQFMNIESKFGNHNAFIEGVAVDIETELIARRNQLEIAAFRNKSFLAFLHSESCLQEIKSFQDQLQNFIVFNKIRLAQPIRNPKELEVVHGKAFLPPEYYTTEPLSEEKKCECESRISFQLLTTEHAFFFNSPSGSRSSGRACIENKV